MQKLDQVYYLPDKAHAFDKGLSGNYPWVFGRKRIVHVPRAHGHFESREEMDELKGRDLEQFIEMLRRSPNKQEMLKDIVLLRPCEAWPAVVTCVNPDGTVDLDVQSNNSGCTLHYRNVVVDHSRTRDHSCHLAEDISDQDYPSFRRLMGNVPAHIKD